MSAKIIVIANEKGGTGKSTLAMHLAVYWLRQNKKVATIDLDGRQGTLSRYLENRRVFMQKKGLELPICENVRLANVSNELLFLRAQLERLSPDYDVIIIDTPGADTALTAEALFMADVLLTPLNDSFLDLDVLALIDDETLRIKAPSHYAERVWSARQKRILMKKSALKWFVVRNRISPFRTRNKQQIEDLLKILAEKIHFSLIDGITDRVIYRELFLKGLTMMDLKENGLSMPLSMSGIVARQEIRLLAENLLVV